MATIKNTDDIRFGGSGAVVANAPAAGLRLTHYSVIFNVGSGVPAPALAQDVTDASTDLTVQGTEEMLLVTERLTPARTLVNGDPMEFLAGSFAFVLPDGDTPDSDVAAVATLKALIKTYGLPSILLGSNEAALSGASPDIGMGADGKQNQPDSSTNYARVDAVALSFAAGDT